MQGFTYWLLPMNKCRNPDHPHCTVWVMPGDSVCAHGHPQPAAAAASPGVVDIPAREPAPGPILPRPQAPLVRPHLRVSGFDPRAAGGRQAIKLELRGMPPDAGAELALLLKSALLPHADERHALTRTRSGGWRPVFIEFSSRGVEHGQHRIEVELHSRQGEGAARAWVCTLVILVPRPDATLGDIHQTFLASHKNVRVSADDGSIARVSSPGGGRVDIEVSARDASIAQLNLEPEPGKIDVGFATIAWDEDLIEIDAPLQAGLHPSPAGAGRLTCAGNVGLPRQVRVFALDEFVLGRFEAVDPQADVLLAHHAEGGEDTGGLTRRLSARHAVIRRGRDGFEIEDVSRFGLLLDGAWPGKHVPVPLRLGMRIELTASIRGVAVLTVSALQPHAVVLHRADAGAAAECFYLLEPERHPGAELAACRAAPQAATLPLLFHRDGGFWHLDPASGRETALAPATALERVMHLPGRLRFATGAYEQAWVPRTTERRRSHEPLPGL
jgi:hypothetical protein